MNVDAKVLNKIFANKYLSTFKSSSTIIKQASSQNPRNGLICAHCLIQYIVWRNRKKKKTPDHLIRCRKGLWHNPILLHDWSPSKFRDANDIDHHFKQAICSKHVVNIIFKGMKLRAILLKSRTIQSYHLSAQQFSVVLEVLIRAIRKVKQNKEIHIVKKKNIKVSLFSNSKIVYLSDLINFPWGNPHSW